MITTVTSPYPGIVDCVQADQRRRSDVRGPRRSGRDATAGSPTAPPPPHAPRLQLDPTNPAKFAVDANGNARGGIRTPQVDAPIATLSGLGQSGTSYCFLFGTTAPFDAAKLAALYPSHAAFVKAWNAATDKAVKAGFILAVDAKNLKAAAAQSTVGGS